MSNRLRILMVWPGAEFSIWDMAAGLKPALEAEGHEVRDYYLSRRVQYHAKAIGDPNAPIAIVSKQASETIIVEALYHEADLILIMSGLNLHPCALWLLARACAIRDNKSADRFRVAVWLSESPYEDADQAEWVANYPGAIVFTNERVSSRLQGWHYLPHAHNPDVHRPVEASGDACDVLLIGTGWMERQTLLERVNWDGIKLRLIGPWPHLAEDHPLKRFHEDYCVRNESIAGLYASAKINLNPHRLHLLAESANPRTFELAACGAFQLSSHRDEIVEIFGDSVPTFANAADLEAKIRYYLAHDAEREACIAVARDRVAEHTFVARARTIVGAVTVQSNRG